MKKLAFVLLLAPMAASCSALRAQSPADRPALEVPPPPPRVVEPAPLQPPIADPVPDLPPPPAPNTSTRSKPQRDPSLGSRESAKPPEKPDATPPPVEAPAPATPTVPPLRTPGTGDPAQTEREIRDIMARASGMLSRVDYAKLSRERKKAYDDAKQFIDQAEGGLKEANFVFARNVAEKAETLAKELTNR